MKIHKRTIKLRKDNSQLYELYLNKTLRKQLACKSEVVCQQGLIDLTNSEYIIEIKKAAAWKHGLGQVLAYSVNEEYCDKKKILYLFHHRKMTKSKKEMIQNTCFVYKVYAIFHDERKAFNGENCRMQKGDLILTIYEK